MESTEAFLLLTLPHATLSTPTVTETGTLGLECVSVHFSEDVYLVMRLNTLEIPIDPTRVITHQASHTGSKIFTFNPTEADPTRLVLAITPPSNPQADFLADLETFESVLAQYSDLRGLPDSDIGVQADKKSDDLRGHLVLVNQESGEVVGELDHKFNVQEDPQLGQKGHEDDPVVIEISDSELTEGSALEVFARAVPPDQQDWITKGATVVSHAISGTTSLFLTVVTSATQYYINHSAPSPHHSSSTSKSAGSSTAPPAPPPRALVFLTSDKTRKGLSNVHAFSGQAVKLSTQTIALIDGMIKRAVGASAKGKAAVSQRTLAPARSAPPTRSPSPSALDAPPPPYASTTSLALPGSSKPALPPRKTPSGIPTPKSPSANSGIATPQAQAQAPPLPPRNLSTTARVLLSADLILSTLDDSAKQVLDVGTERVGAVMGHKYGSEAAHSSTMMAGTARNIGLIYVDMRGIGRKALLKRVGKEAAKGVFSSRKEGK